MACHNYQSKAYGLENMLSLDYPQFLKMIPYKETFYPYGLLYYFKNFYLFWHGIYLLLTVTICFIFFLMLKNIIHRRIIFYVFYVFFLIFVRNFIGFEVFSRYGLITAFGIGVSYFIYCSPCLKRKSIFLWGFLLGMIFSIVFDQGIYAIMLSCLLIFTHMFLYKDKKLVSLNLKVRWYFAQLFFLFLGICSGLIPFTLYLLKSHSLSQFLFFIMRLQDISAFAKVDLSIYFNTPENYFNLFVLGLSLFYLSVSYFYPRKKISLSGYLIFTLTLVLILLEQKYFIRMMVERQITFIPLILLMLMFQEIMHFLKDIGFTSLHILVYAGLCTVLLIHRYPLLPLDQTAVLSSPNMANILIASVKSYKNFLANKCYINTLDGLVHSKAIEELKIKLAQYKSSSDKIFSFPVDPILYPLFSQRPPYYYTMYEATPEYGQIETINYLNQNNVQFIIYNFTAPTIDGVPHYVRLSKVFKYLLLNYSYIDRTDTFLILKKNQSDIFLTKNNIPKSFMTYVTFLNFGSVPKSEGLNKTSILMSMRSKNHLIFNSVNDLNRYTTIQPIYSDKKILVLTPDGRTDLGKQIQLEIKPKNIISSFINFDACQVGKSCVINLEHIPVFYTNREIEQIQTRFPFSGKIELLEQIKESDLW